MGSSADTAGTRVDDLHARAPSPGPIPRKVEESDDDLMRRVAAGDADACRQLVERHLGRIVAFAARVLGDRVEAEDVAQETFLRLWSQATRWRHGEARLSSWLHRVAINLCLDRRRARQHTAPGDVPETADPQADVVRQLQDRDLARHVRAEIMQLTEQQRMAIALCHYQGFSNDEAAEMMAISTEALESLLARARRTLRARLQPLAAELLEGNG